MISREELNPSKHVLTKEQEENQVKLHKAVNELRKIWGKPMIVTSGVRSWEEHVAIYNKVSRPTKIPKYSSHLTGAACDIWDRGQVLGKFLSQDVEDSHKAGKPSLLEKLGLYMESPTVTLTWVHLQITPPKSGNRIFLP
jgi:hypothetical protein